MADGDHLRGLCSAMTLRVADATREADSLNRSWLEKKAELRGLQEGLDCVKAVMKGVESE